MKRQVSAAALVAALISGLGSSAEAGLFFHRRVVYRPVVVVAPPVYVAPVRQVMYAPSPVVYAAQPVVYPAAYYVPAPAYYVPSPVYVGW
jgi:hypothetical protein